MFARVALACGLGAAMLVGAANRAAAQPAGSDTARQEPALVTVTYSVADLVVPIDMEPGEKKHAAATREDQLMKMIRTTVAPKSWSENGGPATMQYHAVGMGLVVQQSPGEHDRIRDLLRNLRRLQDIQVAVEIRLVHLSQGRMGAFDVYQQGRDLSDIQVFQFLEDVQADRNLRVMQAPKMTVFNGQKSKISVIDDHSYVTGIKLIGEKENLMANPRSKRWPWASAFLCGPSCRPISATLRRTSAFTWRIWKAP